MNQNPRNSSAPRWLVSLALASTGLWIGSAAFFSGAVLPLLFLNLEPSEAGRIAALLFPSYFRAGLVAGVAATSAAFAVARIAGRRWRAAAALLLAMTLAQAWSALVLHPEMAAIRGVVGQEARFQQLHRFSVRLNAVVLLGGGILLAAGGWLLTARRDEA